MWTRLYALIIKELLAAFRDPKARMALIIPPILQFFLFAFAATLEVTNVPVGVINDDWGNASVKLVSRLERASAFSEIRHYTNLSAAQAAIDAQEVMVVLHISQDFSRKIAAGEKGDVQVLLDGRKSNSAQMVNNYIGTIINQFSAQWRIGSELEPPSQIVDRSWYNVNRDYREAMVPILVATLPMTMVLMIVGMSVAREQELGTFEQLLVSPLQPIEIIIGKSVPGLIVGLAQCTVMMLIVVYGFDIVPTGSITIFYISLVVFLTAVIGIGLFISSLVSNQQQAMMGIMVTMMPAMLLSGFSSPVQNMPTWLQPLASVNPLTHMLIVIRGVFLRDMPPWLVMQSVWPMVIIAAITMTAAAWMFRRKVE